MPYKSLCSKHLILKQTTNRKYRLKLRKESRCTSCGVPLDEEMDEGCTKCVNCCQGLHRRKSFPEDAPFSSWRSAYHEAGHAVASYNLGITFAYVPTLPEEDCCLGTWKYGDKDLRTIVRTRTEKTIMVHMAGHVAGNIFAGRQNWRASGPDWEASLDLTLLLGHHGMGLKVYTASLLGRTKQMLRQREN